MNFLFLPFPGKGTIFRLQTNLVPRLTLIDNFKMADES